MRWWDSFLRSFGFNRPRLQGRAIATTADNAGADLYTFYLAWNASTDPTVTGYRIYAGQASGGPYTYRGSPKDVGNVLDGSFGVRDPGTYYFVIRGILGAGGETQPTNEIAQTWSPNP
jgi:hypothetical protein